MSATMPQEPFEPGDLAGEYVLGVLGAGDRREAEARMAAESAFADAVLSWQRKLAPLADAILPVEAPAYVWARILSELGLPATRTRTESVRDSWWQRVGVWRWLTAGALALAAAAMVALFVGRPPATPTPASAPLVAVMVLDSGQPAFVATIDRKQGTMVVTPVSRWSYAGRVPELWLIPPGDKAHSLGVVDTSRPITVKVPDALRDAVDPRALVAISVEPPGGSPTGQATGPIIAKGGISNI